MSGSATVFKSSSIKDIMENFGSHSNSIDYNFQSERRSDKNLFKNQLVLEKDEYGISMP